MSRFLFLLDVDECFKTTDNCSENANCTNTQGSFTCVCKTGYNGNGYTCSGIIIYLRYCIFFFFM